MKKVPTRFSLENIRIQSFSTEISKNEKQTIEGQLPTDNILKCTVKIASQIAGLPFKPAKGICAGVGFTIVIANSLDGIYVNPTACAICPPAHNPGATGNGPMGTTCKYLSNDPNLVC